MASSSSPTRHWKFDVFICFHGEDTRKEFTSYLQKALEDKSYIMTFIDEKLEKTKSIDELLTILEKSAISVVIFSPNFAKSTWCLDEVATIAQSMDNSGHRVLPVFYKVEPSDVSGKPNCLYNTNIDKLPKSEKKKKMKVVWKNALKLVCNNSGHTRAETKKDSELVELIVGNVQKIVEDLYPRAKDKVWVDMDASILQVEQLLAMDDNNVTNVRVVGLWGMGGSGKSTLAKACYNKLTPSSTTEGIAHCFIDKINEKYEEQHGVGELIKEVYSQLLPGDNINHHQDINNGSKRARLRQSKVFLVLDDVGTRKQLNELLLGNWFNPTKVFGKGSRIIVTTRDKTVLIAGGDHVKIHPVESWHDAESLKLFSLCAFQQPNPLDGWMDLSNRAVSYCNGNPLAIEVLGGTLCGMDKKYWVDFLSNLTNRQGLTGVHDILMKSYYKLVGNQQRVFLNVACFLYGMLESRVIQCMEVDDYRPRCDVKDLINKSLLVTVASNDGVVIEVHDLLKDVAWIIVNKERDLNKRIMLEDALNINKVLQTTVEQDRATQGISLNLLRAKNMNLEANAFSGMKYLEWLKFYHPQLRGGRLSKINIRSGNIDLPSELKVLQWDKYPLVSQPSGIAPQNLRVLCLRNSSIVKCWEGKCQLVKLVELDLSGCIDLTVIPDLSKSPHLEVLIFQKCKSLIELPSYVGNLEKLVRLNVADCVQLCIIPTQLNSKVLKYVLMSKCENLTYCPEISNSTKLEVLDLEKTPIFEPPPTSTYKRVQNGGTLRLNCKKITSFPTLSSTLSELSLCNTSIREIDFPPPHSLGFESLTQPRFQRLDLNDNLLLKSLPDNIWEMVSTNIFVRNCPLLETLPNISGSVQNGLTRLVVTGCQCLKWVPSSISNLKHLQVLIFAGLAITDLPPSIGELGQLSSLELTNCGSLESIPDTIYDLAKLYVLVVSGCSILESLPRLPPSLVYLTARGCRLLQNLPRNIEELTCKEIWLDCCSLLDNDSTGNMLTNVLDQSIDLHSEGNILYPGSQLPWRLHYKSEEGKIVEVKLPSASASQQLKGFFFGAVTLRSRSGIQHLRCFCQIKLADGSRVYFGSWGSSVLVSVDRVSLNHVHIWFTNQLGRPLKNQTEDDDDDEDKEEEEEETEEVWYVKYAGLTVSFIFYSVNDNKFMDIKRCGVTLLY